MCYEISTYYYFKTQARKQVNIVILIFLNFLVEVLYKKQGDQNTLSRSENLSKKVIKITEFHFI